MYQCTKEFFTCSQCDRTYTNKTGLRLQNKMEHKTDQRNLMINPHSIVLFVKWSFNMTSDEKTFGAFPQRLLEILFEIKMSLNFGNINRTQDTSNFLEKTDAKLQTNLNMNDHEIIKLSTPTDDDDATNKKYVDDLVDSVGVAIIDPGYSKPKYTTDMRTNGPFDAKSAIVGANPDSLITYNYKTLKLEFNDLTTVLPREGQEMYVLAGLNEVSGHISSAKFELTHPAFGISFVGVFGQMMIRIMELILCPKELVIHEGERIHCQLMELNLTKLDILELN